MWRINLQKTISVAFLLVLSLMPKIIKCQESFFIEKNCFIHYSDFFDTGNILVFFGTTNITPIGRELNQHSDRVFVLWTDYHGKLLDKIIFNEYNSVRLLQVQMTSDSSYIMLLHKFHDIYCDEYSILVKIDMKGNILWNKTINIIGEKISIYKGDNIQLFGNQCALNYSEDRSEKTVCVNISSKDGSVKNKMVIHTQYELNDQNMFEKINNSIDKYAYIFQSAPSSMSIDCEIPKIVTAYNYFRPEEQFNYSLEFINSNGHTINNEVCFNFDGTIHKVMYDTLNNCFICLGYKEIISIDSSEYRYSNFIPASMITANRIFALVDTTGKLIFQKVFDFTGIVTFYSHLLSNRSLFVTYNDNQTDSLAIEYFLYENSMLISKFKKSLNFGPNCEIKNIGFSKNKNEIYIFYTEELEKREIWIENLMLARIELPEY